MSLANCIRDFKAWAKENSPVEFTASDLENVGKLLSYAEEHGQEPAEKTAMMAQFVEQKLAREQAVARAVRIKNALTNEKNLTEVLANGEAWSNDGARRGKAYIEATNAKILGGATRPGTGSNLDPFATKAATNTQFRQFMATAFGKGNLKIFQGMVNDSDMARDYYLELDALRSKPDMLGKTNNEIALAMAKATRATQDFSLSRLKGVSPHFSENGDFLQSRNYERDLMAKISRTEFIKRMMARFGDSSLAGMTPKEKYDVFGGIYDDKKSGAYVPGEVGDQNEWGATRNQAPSPRRVLTANSALDEWAHAKDFGRTPFQVMTEALDDRAQKVATVQKWGLNAGNNVAELYDRTLAHLQKVDPDAAEEYAREKSNFKKAYEATQVRNANEAYKWTGKFTQATMAVTHTLYQGNHVPRSLNSWSTAMDLTKDVYGQNMASHAAELAQKMAIAMSPGGNGGREAAMALGVPLTRWEADCFRDLAPGAAKPGLATRYSQLLGRLALTDRFVSSGKSAVAQVEAGYLAGQAHLPFEKLSDKGQAELARYNLHGSKWEVLRRAVAKEGETKGLITPESILNLTDEQTKPALRDNATARDALAARSEIATNYSTYLSDKAGLSMGESNARSRFAAYGNSKIDDVDGMGRRFMMQFKNAALTDAYNVQRMYHNGGGSTSGAGAVLSHAVKATFLGLVGAELINYGKSQSLADPRDPAMWGRAVANGMGAGVMGDMLFNALQGRGGRFDKALMASDLVGAGPGLLARGAAATLNTGLGAAEYLQGNEKANQFGGKAWAQLLGDMVPGKHIFYTSGAINYMLVNEIHQAMGDNGYLGYLRRGAAATQAWPEALGGPGGGQTMGFGGQNFWEQ